MEWFVYVGVILLLFLIMMISGFYHNRKAYKYLRQSLKDNYGKIKEDCSMSSDDFTRISKYHHKKCESLDQNIFELDEMTSRDLSLNDLFARMNNTLSTPGEEYLYHRLHTVSLTDCDDNFYNLCNFFDETPETRLNLQIWFHDLGKITRFSLTDILHYANSLKVKSNIVHYLIDFGMLAGIGLIFVNPGIGTLVFCGFLCYSIISYFQMKADISPYFTTFAYINRMLEISEKIIKSKNNELAKDCEQLKNAASTFNGFKRGSYVLSSDIKLTENPLELILDYARMILHIDIIKFNHMLSFMQAHINEIEVLRELLGKLDAAIAFASFRNTLQYYCIPNYTDDCKINLTGAFHPLIKEPVANSIETNTGILITGSNASGKSTFIKTVALCAIMAQSFGIVPAKEYVASRFKIMTSMALTDNLLGNESYFIVEIKSLKRILDESSKDQKVLCFVDEVLRGTNTVERIAASSQILNSLRRNNVICFAATHDIELTHILEEKYNNYHFDEEIINDDICFSYILKEGRSNTRNAIKLLSVIGYEKSVIDNAESMAAEFLRTNNWSRI